MQAKYVFRPNPIRLNLFGYVHLSAVFTVREVLSGDDAEFLFGQEAGEPREDKTKTQSGGESALSRRSKAGKFI
ncbi:MAG: hypothetical protein ACRDBL_06680, partial [Rhabdaerophilum sp.]